MINCLFVGNLNLNDSIFRNGGAIFVNHDGSLRLTNSTVAFNRSPFTVGGAVRTRTSNVDINNTIFWDNTDINGSGEEAQISLADLVDPINLNYSNVQGLTGILGGIGNIDGDPLFVDLGRWDDAGTPDDLTDDQFIPGDYRLRSGSPATDAADNMAVPEEVQTDLAGQPRFVDDPETHDTGSGSAPIVDMGAFEFQAARFITLDIKPQQCPNRVNPRSKGVFSLAIAGEVDFDVQNIDTDSLALALTQQPDKRIKPNLQHRAGHSSIVDLTSPVQKTCRCHRSRPDGLNDLVIRFPTTTLSMLLDSSSTRPGSSVTLTLTGNMIDGSRFEGIDCILIPGIGNSRVNSTKP